MEVKEEDEALWRSLEVSILQSWFCELIAAAQASASEADRAEK